MLFVSYQHHASGLNLHVASHVIVAHPYAAPVTSPTAPELASLAAAAAAFERQGRRARAAVPQTKPCRLYRVRARHGGGGALRGLGVDLSVRFVGFCVTAVIANSSRLRGVRYKLRPDGWIKARVAVPLTSIAFAPANVGAVNVSRPAPRLCRCFRFAY